jgi:hypothetical protein
MSDRLARLAADYAAQPRVAAVACAGSRTTGLAGSGSDTDVYVYVTAALPLAVRESIARGPRVEVDNRFFEPGDEWLDGSGQHYDVMFRDVRWLEEQLDRVLLRHEASVGYSTAFWHNVRVSRILFDRDGWFAAQWARAQAAYPEPLRRAIVAKNRPLLAANLSSYLRQLELAVVRDDPVSAQHRTSAFLASLFDILFALNRVPHPGEKRLLEHARRSCPLLPPDFDRNVRALIAATGRPPALDHGNRLAEAMDDLLRAEGLLDSDAFTG